MLYLYMIQQIDSSSQIYLRIGRSGFHDIKIDSTGVSILNNLTIGGSTTFSSIINNGVSNFYNSINLLNSSLQSLNKIVFNNNTGNGNFLSHNDDSGVNKFTIGRIVSNVSYFDFTINNSDGLTTINNSAVINGSTIINNY